LTYFLCRFGVSRCHPLKGDGLDLSYEMARSSTPDGFLIRRGVPGVRRERGEGTSRSAEESESFASISLVSMDIAMAEVAPVSASEFNASKNRVFLPRWVLLL